MLQTLKRLFRSANQGSPRASLRVRPGLETLENRLTPALMLPLESFSILAGTCPSDCSPQVAIAARYQMSEPDPCFAPQTGLDLNVNSSVHIDGPDWTIGSLTQDR